MIPREPHIDGCYFNVIDAFEAELEDRIKKDIRLKFYKGLFYACFITIGFGVGTLVSETLNKLQPPTIEIRDLNNDGHLDAVLTDRWGDKTHYLSQEDGTTRIEEVREK